MSVVVNAYILQQQSKYIHFTLHTLRTNILT